MSAASERLDPPDGLTLAEVASLVDGSLEGDGGLRVSAVAPVDEAAPEELAFLARKGYAHFAGDSRARAFLVSTDLRVYVPEGRSCVVVGEPYPALRILLSRLHPEAPRGTGVHPTAILGRGVDLGEGVLVGPYAVLEANVAVGTGTEIGAHCVVGRGTTIGERTRLHPHVVVYDESVIGSEVILHAGARIGTDGFGYAYVDGEHRKMPQVGRAVVEDGAEIGANTTIDRGSLGDTVVGRGVKLDNLVHIAHNVKVGALTLMSALSGVAGSTRVGKGTWVGGQAGIINQLDIGDGVRIAARAGVFRDVPPGETVSGNPARPHREEMRKQAQLARLPRLVERVERLEAELERLSGTP